MWLLTIEDEEGTTTYHRLARRRCTVGRGSDNDVVLSQLDVSRRHARFEREGGAGDEGGAAPGPDDGGGGAQGVDRGGGGGVPGVDVGDDGGTWIVADEGSDNGTFVNGNVIDAPTRLGVDDVLQIGGYRLSFSEGDHTDVPTPAPRYVPPARLRVLAGPSAGTEHVFGRDEIVTLGRSDDCSVRLLHENIIGVHAMVQPLPGGRYEVVDTSGYGIFVNGRGVARRVLEGGDAINIGGVALLRFLESRQASDPRFDGLAATVAPPPAEHDTVEIDPPGDARAEPVEPGGRFEAVGPKTLPPAGLEPASFRAARDSSVRAGRGRDPGDEAAVVAAREAAGAGREAGARARREPGGAAGLGEAGEGGASVAGQGSAQARPWWPLGEVDEGSAVHGVPLPSAAPKAATAKSGVAAAPALGWLAALRLRRESLRLAALAFAAMAMGLACAAMLMRTRSAQELSLTPEGGNASGPEGRAAPARSAIVSTTVAAKAGDAKGEPAVEPSPAEEVAAGSPVKVLAPPAAAASGREPAYAPASVRGGSAALKRKQHCWKQEGGPCVERR